MSGTPSPLSVRCYFVRKRNALLTRGQFSDLAVDYYLALADSKQVLTEPLDRLLREATAAICLHAATRPWKEVIAWTFHFEEPLCNLFVSASNPEGRVVGTAYADDSVRRSGKNLLYSDVVSGSDPLRRSVIEFDASTGFEAAEILYEQSEQRPGRFFSYAEEDYVFLSAQPDCDLDWLQGLTGEDIRTLDQTEELSLLETRSFRWECGCTQERMFSLLAPNMQSDPDALFGEDASLRIRCPRCGTRHLVTREALEGYLVSR